MGGLKNCRRAVGAIGVGPVGLALDSRGTGAAGIRRCGGARPGKGGWTGRAEWGSGGAIAHASGTRFGGYWKGGLMLPGVWPRSGWHPVAGVAAVSARGRVRE